MTTFTIEKKSIKDVFIKPNERFVIPRFQRQYAWLEGNIQEFWDTIIDDEEVFLGTLIFNVSRKNSDGIIEIIDGQQRYLTIQILAAVLRDFCQLRSKETNDRYEQIGRGVTLTLLAHENPFRMGDFNFNLIPGDSIKDFFRTYIQDPTAGARMSADVPTGKSLERDRIKKAYLVFRERLNQKIEGMSDEQIQVFIEDLVNRRLGPHFFARIEIDTEELAYEIFETVNAKRVDLNVADLIKNQIFRHVVGPAGGVEDSAKHKWSQITETLEEINFSMKDFIVYYWNSKYGYVAEKKLYRAIRTQFKRAEEWKAFLDELETNVEYLGLIFRGTEQDIADSIVDRQEAKRIYESLRVLRSLQAKNWAILYLCLFRHISSDGGASSRIPISLKKKWEIFAKFTFVYYQILSLGGNWYFKTMWSFCSAIEELVREKKTAKVFDTKFNELFASLNGQLPKSKEDFIDGFVSIKYKLDSNARTIIRYVLSEIESSMGDRYDVGFDESLVNIEHVLPQKPVEWGLKKAEIKDVVNNIGNLLLISIAGNGSIGNKPLPDKIEMLKKLDKLRHVVDFVDKVETKTWDFARIASNKDFSAVEARGRHLGEQAYAIWVEDLRRKMGF